MNSSSFRGSRALFFVAILSLGMSLGCGGDQVGPSVSLTDDDVATLLASVMATGSGGLQLYVTDAASIAHGGDLHARADKRGDRSIARDTTFRRNHTVTIGGNTYTFDYNPNFTITYTDLVGGSARNYYYPGNIVVKLVDNTPSPGTFDIPTLSARDSIWMDIRLYNTDKPKYFLDGHYGRVGTYTFPGGTKTFTGRIEGDGLIPGITVDSTSGMIIDAGTGSTGANGATTDMSMILKGTTKDGAQVLTGGTFVFRPGQPPTIIVNNKYYTFDRQTGKVTAQ